MSFACVGTLSEIESTVQDVIEIDDRIKNENITSFFMIKIVKKLDIVVAVRVLLEAIAVAIPLRIMKTQRVIWEVKCATTKPFLYTSRIKIQFCIASLFLEVVLYICSIRETDQEQLPRQRNTVFA